MAGKNQASLAVCAQTKVIFPFKFCISVFHNSFKISLSIKCDFILSLHKITTLPGTDQLECWSYFRTSLSAKLVNVQRDLMMTPIIDP